MTTLIIVGAVLEVGIEPTARHSADLGFLPVVVQDACGVVHPEIGKRSLAALDYTHASHRCSSAKAVEPYRVLTGCPAGPSSMSRGSARPDLYRGPV